MDTFFPKEPKPVKATVGALGVERTPKAPTSDAFINANPSAWRQRKAIDHKITFDTAQHVVGRPGEKTEKNVRQRELAAVFMGVHAKDAWRGVMQFDEFRQRISAVNPPLPLEAESGGLSDADVANIALA